MRSIVIIISVAIGLFAGIAVLALYNGMLHGRVCTVIDAEVAHIQIHDTSFKKDYDPAYVIVKGDSILKALRLMTQVKAFFCQEHNTGNVGNYNRKCRRANKWCTTP